MPEGAPRSISNADLKCLLEPEFGQQLLVEECEMKSNTQAGENYGSVMLALDIKLRRTGTSAAETLHVVAKFAPPTQFLQTVFDFKNTFCKEMNLYKLVSPEIDKIQRENGIQDRDILDVLPKFYGAQTSAGGNVESPPDENAVILLENLKVTGYMMADRSVGLDLKHSELVMSKLAEFHALPIAIKQKRPDRFQKTVLKATADFLLGGGMGNPEEDIGKIVISLRQQIPECYHYIARIQRQCLDNLNVGNKTHTKSPFATIIHNDLWTNNMMFLYEDPHDSSSPTSIKFVDFQVTLLCSVARDIIFFLFTSTSDEVFKDCFDHLLKVYYSNFINTLKKMECDVSPFSFEKFLSEINDFAPHEFHHILFMLNVVYAEKKDIKELSEIDGSEELSFASGSVCKHKITTLIHEFDKRGWLCKSA